MTRVWQLAPEDVVDANVIDQTTQPASAAQPARGKAKREPWPNYAKAVLVFLMAVIYEMVIIFWLAGNVLTGLLIFAGVLLVMTLVFLLVTGVAAFTSRLQADCSR